MTRAPVPTHPGYTKPPFSGVGECGYHDDCDDDECHAADAAGRAHLHPARDRVLALRDNLRGRARPRGARLRWHRRLSRLCGFSEQRGPDRRLTRRASLNLASGRRLVRADSGRVSARGTELRLWMDRGATVRAVRCGARTAPPRLSISTGCRAVSAGAGVGVPLRAQDRCPRCPGLHGA